MAACELTERIAALVGADCEPVEVIVCVLSEVSDCGEVVDTADDIDVLISVFKDRGVFKAVFLCSFCSIF